MELWLAHRRAPQCSDAALLAQNPHLEDLLLPLIEQQDEAGAGAATKSFGAYRLLDEVGRGGAGVVYEAVQQPLGRRVALKVLASGLLHEPQAVARFRREAVLLGRLKHAHIVPIHDAGVVDGVPFHAMEFVDGCNLADVCADLRGREVDPCDGDALRLALCERLQDPEAGHWLSARSYVESCVRLVDAVAVALCQSHELGVLHRDVKPANILLGRDGTPMLSDFGLARDLREPGLTQAGSFVGTPYYVSPEQASGRAADVDARSDVFSLAVVLYELLVRTRPFDGDTTEAVLASVCLREPAALRRPPEGVPADLLAVLEKALRKEPDERYPSMRAFADELQRVLTLRPVQARRRGVLARTWSALARRPRQSAAWLAVVSLALAATYLAVYVGSQQGRIADATARERMPDVERLLERAMLHHEEADWARARADVDRAAELVPDVPEVLAAQALLAAVGRDRKAVEQVLARLEPVAPSLAKQFVPGEPAEPQSSLGWFVLGMRRMEEGHQSGDPEKFAAAARALRRTIDRAAAPRSLFHCQYLHALMHLRDAEAVRTIAADALHLWPQSPFVAYWRGFALMKIEPEQAERELLRALQLMPDMVQARLRLARHYELSHDLVRAEQMLRSVLEQRPSAGARVALARVLRSQRRADESLVVLQQQHAGGLPYRLEAERALALLAMGRRQEAVRAARAALALAPDAPIALVTAARVLQRVGKLDEACELAERACQKDPSNYDAFARHAVICARRRDHAAAEQSFAAVVQLKPDHLSAWCDLAKMRRIQRNFDGAEQALATASTLDPHNGSVLLQTGHLRRAQGRSREALAAFEAAAASNPRDAESRINVAGWREQEGDTEGMLALLAEARALQPGWWEGYAPAVRVLQATGRIVEAEQLLHVWCQRPRTHGKYWMQLAQLRRRSESHSAELAAQALAKAAERFGDRHPNVLAERGLQALAAGDAGRARQCFEAALAAGLRGEVAQEVRARLNER